VRGRAEISGFAVASTSGRAPWWIVQPDVQVILHPGGRAIDPSFTAGTRAIPDAVIVGVRASNAF
jgi:porin